MANFKTLFMLLFVFSLLAASNGYTAIVAEYNASGVVNQRPDELALNPWVIQTNVDLVAEPTAAYDAGNYLLVNLSYDSDAENAGDYARWISPTGQTVVMENGGSNYGIEAKVRPLEDLKSTGYSYEYGNIEIVWSDNVSSYLVSVDMDSDDAGAGTVGRITRGKYPMITILDGINWSTAHTIGIIYDGSKDVFYFYLDGVYLTYVKAIVLRSDAKDSNLQGKVAFGDYTTGGNKPDYNTEWYFVRLYDAAFLTLPTITIPTLEAEYDASAVVGQRPDQTATPWVLSSNVDLDSNPTVVYDAGNYLMMNFSYDADAANAGDHGTWTSPLPAVTPIMINGVGQYSIDVKVRPLEDMKSTGYSYEHHNITVHWSDDQNLYAIAFDKDSDDTGAGTTGRVVKAEYPMGTLIDGIDWSAAHKITIVYDGTTNAFFLYLDDVYQTFVLSGGLKVSSSASDVKDRVKFGDNTTGGYNPDYNAEWYFVRMYSTAIKVLPDVDTTLIAEYDASKVNSLRPDQVNPAWTYSGNVNFATAPTAVYDAGDYLLQNLSYDSDSQNAGDYAMFQSPASQSVPMVNGSGQYGFMARVRPLEDLKSTGYGYEATNIFLAWSDDVNWYIVSIDKDADDDSSGTMGRITRNTYPMNTIISGVDWSVPHTIGIAYDGAGDVFKFYLDGFYRASVSSADLKVGNSYAPYIGRIYFGDGGTGGFNPDYNAEWYFVRLYAETTTITQGVCGDIAHQYPIGDLNKDCLVDFFDIAGLAQDWMIDNRP
jgi:hypothetical protein